MMPDQWVLFLVIGLAAGVMSGLFGIGGGVIIVPALSVFAGLGTTEAVATSSTALLLPVGIFAVIAYYRAGLLKPRASALVALGLLLTSYIGSEIAISLPERQLEQVYGLFLLYISWRFMEPRKVLAEIQAGTFSFMTTISGGASADEKPELPEVHWSVILLVGLVAGVASGMFGIGGGAVIVPALVVLLKFDQKLAVGTSLGALLGPVGLPAVLNFADEGVLELEIGLLVAVGLLFGAIVGARIALGLPSKTIKRLYGVFLLFVALRFILG